VIDLRCLRPIDKAAIVASVKTTGRLLSVYEGVKTLGIGAEISAMVSKFGKFTLDIANSTLIFGQTPTDQNRKWRVWEDVVAPRR
jgi:pyruvate dehydrogenase E1 component beta subunit